MGKKKMKAAAGVGSGGESQHCPSTVFVTGLPYSLINAQLEESFSEIGPIKRCFMVMKKGSSEHRGFGFVQFAAVKDANRAIEVKNGTMVGGRKIQVKHAMHRAPMEQRRAKGSKGDLSEDFIDTVDEKVNLPVESVKHEGLSNSKLTVNESGNVDCTQKRDADKDASGGYNEKAGSEKQRVARTVVVGGLLNADMAEDVHQRARECGTLCSITYPLLREKLEHHGLAQDGCKMDASSVLYKSVKSACLAVATLHQKEIHGGLVWARQLGGEGSKTQKWKIIVRNLPFKATVNDIKDMFSAVVFVWDIVIPQNSKTGLSKGFAFLKFVSKRDAEKAINMFNGKHFGKRPIAVDWAVPKKIYSSGGKSLVDSEEGQSRDGDSDSSIDLEDDDVEINDKSLQDKKHDIVSEGCDSAEEFCSREVNFDEEADIARKVLINVTSLTSKVAEGSEIDNLRLSKEKDDDKSSAVSKKSTDAINTPIVNPGSFGKSKLHDKDPLEREDEIQKTIFIRNLPFDISKEDVTQRFSAFGEVESFLPVLHSVTKRPTGTGFLKFKTADCADAAILASNAASGVGILLKGRQLKILKALHKKEAQDKVLEKTKKEDSDHRNLYLAKEGVILEDTPAAVGVSASDMYKRKMLQKKKKAKLQSPNCHVSRTRLVIYNLPKSMNEKELKQLCIHAVTSRATKQKPQVQQIKILKDSKKGNSTGKDSSRGVAFVEFLEHQHALVALRVLNNNPETFGSEHRPIVEFAVDNVLKLRNRKGKDQAQKKYTINDDKNLQQNDKSVLDHHPKEKSRKRKFRHDSKAADASKSEMASEAGTEVFAEASSKEAGASKKLKSHASGKKETKKKLKVLEERTTPDGGIPAPAEGTSSNIHKAGHQEAAWAITTRRKLRDGAQQEKESMGLETRKKSRKNNDPLGRDVVDKLDALIEQYKSKFSRQNSDQTDHEKQGSKSIRRWFQS